MMLPPEIAVSIFGYAPEGPLIARQSTTVAIKTKRRRNGLQLQFVQ